MTKRRGIIFLALLLAIVLGIALFALRTPSSAFDKQASAPTSGEDLIRHGEYVARLSDCVACHSTPDGAPFAGGLEMATPVGNITATNITPDKETGIGNYSLADFDRAVRHGVAKQGHRLYPAMPYPSYVKLSDDDVRALYAWFMHDVKPVNQPNKASDIPWPLNMRWPLAFWNLAFSGEGTWQPDPQRDAQWNRGAYIVEGPGHCGSCHTPRGAAFNEKGLDASSPHFLAGALLDGWYAPSLRGDTNTGMARWSEQDVYDFLKQGRNKHSVVFGSMTDAFNNSTQFMTDEDLRAVAHYLKVLPPGSNNADKPWQYQADAGNSDRPGAPVYAARCASCHGADGRGQAPWIPPLAGATSMQVDSASAINVTLNGSGRVVADGVPDAYRMPPYRRQLSDQQVADVLSYIRGAWGNNGNAVTAEQVKTLREAPDPASSEVIILHMR